MEGATKGHTGSLDDSSHECEGAPSTLGLRSFGLLGFRVWG